MASTYDEEQKKLEEERKKLQQQQTEAAAGQYGQAAIDAGKTTYNYNPSDALIAARQYLDTQMQQKPAPYISRYTDQLSGILSRIQGRQPFQYDAAADPLYNVYKDLYIQNGRRAMQDTMGQAAALTGGYGNSYGRFAGQQQYGQYMENLNAMIPQLQQQAYQQYQGEGENLRELYQLMNSAENMEYGKYRDLLGDWQNQLQQAQQLALQYAQLAYKYEQANKKSSGGGYTPKKTEEPTATQTAEEIQKNGTNFIATLLTKNEYSRRKAVGSSAAPGATYDDYVSQKIDDAYNAGKLSKAEANFVIDYYKDNKNQRNNSTRR